MTGNRDESRIAKTLSFGQPVGGLIQLGFVVEDLAAAMAEFTERMSAGPWFVIRNFAGVNPVYRGSPALALCDIALGFSGHMQIELIQQMDEHPSVYREKPPETRFGFHHFGIAARDFDAAADSYRKAGHQEAFTAAVPSGGRVVYFDPGGAMPGMIELIEADDGLDQMFGAIYQASVGWDGSDPVREAG